MLSRKYRNGLQCVPSSELSTAVDVSIKVERSSATSRNDLKKEEYKISNKTTSTYILPSGSWFILMTSWFNKMAFDLGVMAPTSVDMSSGAADMDQIAICSCSSSKVRAPQCIPFFWACAEQLVCPTRSMSGSCHPPLPATPRNWSRSTQYDAQYVEAAEESIASVVQLAGSDLLQERRRHY